MGRSRAGIGQRCQGNILCHYAMRGHLLHNSKFWEVDFPGSRWYCGERAMSGQPAVGGVSIGFVSMTST